MMMSWDGLEEDDDDDKFFESRERMSTSVPIDLASYGPDEDEEFIDSRMSFASAMASPSDSRVSSAAMSDIAGDSLEMSKYNVWMADLGSIKERRMRLFQGMGLFGDKESLRIRSTDFGESAKHSFPEVTEPLPEQSPQKLPPSSSFRVKKLPSFPSVLDDSFPPVVARSRSDVAATAEVDRERRRRELLGSHLPPIPPVRRTPSAPSSLSNSSSQKHSLHSCESPTRSANGFMHGEKQLLSPNGDEASSFCKIKNLDTGKEFIMNEDGTWNCPDDSQKVQQLTMEEFEKCVGYSPIVKELMRRENVRISGADPTLESGSESAFAKSFRSSTLKKKSGWLKNIKGVATSVSGMIAEKDKDGSVSSSVTKSKRSSKWMKVRAHGTNCKEFSALYMSQEIQAHQGSIWSIKFSLDARYLASAGEDRIIHVWEVLECEAVMSVPEEPSFGPSRSMANRSLSRPPLAEKYPSRRRGKLSSSSKKCSIPEYVVVPETVMSLSDKPVCSFQGHLDDVLDLSWSKSQFLLSSSMDKTVRLWDMESKTCLHLFAHNDYVTCIQFNPVDDRYFISGSLDAKVRIWSIPGRQVVDWSDLHEMVTAACYTPDGQGALVGSHTGSCRLYDTSECKLQQKGQIDIESKKKKSHAKKITGFQFAPGKSSEVLITSADSQIRIFDGTDLVQKFRGFRNTSSQIAASFTADGKHVVCASEDSNVYVWKRDELLNISTSTAGNGGDGDGGASSTKTKSYISTKSHEHFQCRDVSVAIPWPGGSKHELPPMPIFSKRHHHGRRSSSVQPSALEDNPTNSSRNLLPPLPRKSFSDRNNNTEDDQPLSNSHSPLSDPGICGTPSFSSSRCRSNGSMYSSSASFSSLSWYDANNSVPGGPLQVPTAWGLAIVTAGLGGEIKVYQNFGLPVRLQNQSILRL